MEVERIIGALAGRRRGDALGRGEGELVRLADDEALEAHALVQRRAADIDQFRFAGLGACRSRFRRLRRRLASRGCSAAADHGLRQRRRGGIARGLTNGEQHAVRRREFGDAVHPQPLGIMGFEPALQEAGRDGEVGHGVDDARKLEAGEPAREDILAELGAQTPPHALPGVLDRRIVHPRRSSLLGCDRHHHRRRLDHVSDFLPLEHQWPHSLSNEHAFGRAVAAATACPGVVVRSKKDPCPSGASARQVQRVPVLSITLGRPAAGWSCPSSRNRRQRATFSNLLGREPKHR